MIILKAIISDILDLHIISLPLNLRHNLPPAIIIAYYLLPGLLCIDEQVLFYVN